MASIWAALGVQPIICLPVLDGAPGACVHTVVLLHLSGMLSRRLLAWPLWPRGCHALLIALLHSCQRPCTDAISRCSCASAHISNHTLLTHFSEQLWSLVTATEPECTTTE